ncbi:PilZ domain-containing protein [Novosphingobium sp.]|uniref:PilZ domain-containing protein n=1 Tax=Novosphingobium sp. TaxID=1874826 RepID=UPI0035B09C42
MASEPVFEATGGRKAERKQYEAVVQFRFGTKRATVKVCDISPFGARVQGVYLVHPEDRFWIKIGHIEPIEARVAWVEDFEFGCEFIRPLNQAIFEAVTR